MKEPDKNIVFMCKECSDDMYPLKGKFSAETIKKASAAKFVFGDLKGGDKNLEHMWLTDLNVISGDLIQGKLDNDPVYVRLKLGQIITRKISEVEELIFD